MLKKQIAILDVGSSKITACIGERGVNKTFIIKGKKNFKYEGFCNELFFDEEQVKKTIENCFDYLSDVLRIKFDSVYIGVPGEFTKVFVKDAQIVFKKKKKITEKDINLLFESAFVNQEKSTLINRSAIRYELDDYRRLANPIGYATEILKGKLTFIVCNSYFTEIFKPILQNKGVENIEFISSSLAEAMYLIEDETRDRIALLLDVGYITSTLSLIQGDGILFQKSFSYGGGYITAALLNKFSLTVEKAEELKKKINLCRLTNKPYDSVSISEDENFNTQEIIKTAKDNLDILCENISEAIEESGYLIPEYVPLYITGGGISYIRGAKVHISNRLGMIVEIISPNVPLMDKPSESSLLSLLDMSLGQE